MLDESLRGARESLALALTLNDVELEAIHRYRLANNMLSKQSHADNVAMALQALDCVREVGNPSLESEILLVLSFLHFMAPEAGMVYLKQAQAISEEIDSIYIQIRILRSQANFFSQMGELDRAGEYLQRALKKAKKFLNKQQEVNVLQDIGTLTKDQGQLDDSIQAHSKAITLCRAAGFRKQEAILLGNLGLIAQLNGESDRAEIIYEEALMLFQQMGHTGAQGCAAGNLGDLMLSQGRLKESSAHLNQAIALCDEKYGACFRGSLAWVRAQQGDIAGARLLLDEGEIHLRGVWIIELGRLFCRRAQVEHTAGEPEAAAEALAEARRIAKQSGAGPMSDLGQLITEAAEACRQ
jgi:tetratricopeptide (TPR) repeat protein